MRVLMKYMLFLLLLAGCVKEADWNPPGESPSMLVVDAILSDEVKQHKITLAGLTATVNQIPPPFTGATVLVSNEDSTWQFREDSLVPGNYLSPSWFSARLNRSYTLLISRGDSIYSAVAGIVPVAPFPELRYARSEENGLYYVDWIANAFSVGDASMWEILVDWSDVPGYEGVDPQLTRARMLFYTLPTLDVTEIFAPRIETTYFPAGSAITERRYALTPAHAAFVRELLLETSWSGGLFAVAPANPATNLSAGATGFFGVCAVYELSVIVNP